MASNLAFPAKTELNMHVSRVWTLLDISSRGYRSQEETLAGRAAHVTALCHLPAQMNGK
jgi:hypothetical protein